MAIDTCSDTHNVLVSLTSGSVELHTALRHRPLVALRRPLLDPYLGRQKLPDRIHHCLFIEDGTGAVCGGIDGRVLIYGLRSKQTALHPIQTLNEEDSIPIQCLAVCRFLIVCAFY